MYLKNDAMRKAKGQKPDNMSGKEGTLSGKFRQKCAKKIFPAFRIGFETRQRSKGGRAGVRSKSHLPKSSSCTPNRQRAAAVQETTPSSRFVVSGSAEQAHAKPSSSYRTDTTL